MKSLLINNMPLKSTILIAIALNASPAFSIQNSHNPYTVVVKAGSPLLNAGATENIHDWQVEQLITDQKNMRKAQVGGYALSSYSNTATSTMDMETEHQKYLSYLVKTRKDAKLAIKAVLAPTNAATTVNPKTLILYDYRPNDSFGKLGKAYAIMLRNLLGHFTTNITMIPIDSYVAGSANSFDATFYLGTYYGNTVNSAFLSDAKATTSKIVWFKYNLDQITQWTDANGAFAQQFGFYFNGLQGMNAAPTAANPAPGFFDTVLYKNRSFGKYYAFDAASNAIFADVDLGQTTISNSTKANIHANIKNAKTGAVLPYIVKANNFWYIADTPFSYTGPRDRYLVFADMLHEILGTNQPEQHRAMVRLEDMSELINPANVATLSNYFYGDLTTVHAPKIPFSMAVVPHYVDAFGLYNGNVPIEIPLANATKLKTAINSGLSRGGKVVMHGFTHQFGTFRNSNSGMGTGVSTDDYEFWDMRDQDGNPETYDPRNSSIPGETTSSVLARIDAGKAELAAAGYTPFAFEIPHYQGSPIAYRAIQTRFPTVYERAVYYTSETPDLNPANPARDIAVGQFFPYVIKQDYYGRKVLPENLGNIEYNICANDSASCQAYSWQDLSINANYALVVRDGFASFFFHPFWLETFPANYNINGLADLKSLVNSINALGYTWVGADTL